MLSVIGLITAIVVLMIGTFKRINIFPMTILCAAIAGITSGLDLWVAFSEHYASGFGSIYSGYFMLFALSCLYSQLMEQSGSVQVIAYKIIDWVGKKNILVACCIAASFLVYGGVNGFVIAYVMVPIMMTLFHEANIHRKYMMCVIVMANGTFTMGYLPGSTQMSNLIPTQFFGTTLNAAPVMGILATILIVIMQLTYITKQAKKSQKQGECFMFPDSVDPKQYEGKNSQNGPSAVKAFAPMIIMIAMALFGGKIITNATILSVVAVLTGAACAFLLNINVLLKKNLKNIVSTATVDGINTLCGWAAVTGMATVFQHTVGFEGMVDGIIASNMNPYIKGSLAAAIMSLFAGSGSAGIRIALNSMGEYLLTSGANLEILHRVMAICSLPLSNTPNCAGHYVSLKLIDMTQADCYKDTFFVNLVFGSIVAVVFLTAAVVLY